MPWIKMQQFTNLHETHFGWRVRLVSYVVVSSKSIKKQDFNIWLCCLKLRYPKMWWSKSKKNPAQVPITTINWAHGPVSSDYWAKVIKYGSWKPIKGTRWDPVWPGELANYGEISATKNLSGTAPAQELKDITWWIHLNSMVLWGISYLEVYEVYKPTNITTRGPHLVCWNNTPMMMYTGKLGKLKTLIFFGGYASIQPI